jgi:endonuclease III
LVKAQDRIKAITSFVESSYRQSQRAFRDYPQDILELILFHKMHFFMAEEEAVHRFHRLKETFVDWNEVRISSVKEIQEVFAGLEDALELSIFVKDLLEQVHRDQQSVSLEFLAARNLSDIRRYLRAFKGIDPATINLVLRLRKEYPVLPVSDSMELTLERLGVFRPGDKREHKEKYLHNLVDQDHALPFHHFFLMHSREICPPDEGKIQCQSCAIRRSCNYYARHRRTNGKTPPNK